MRQPDALLSHLRHAEEWLGRARRDHRRGDHRAAVLRLMLAEAEIRRARETGMQLVEAPPARPVRRLSMAVGAFGVAAMAVIGYMAFVGNGGTTPTNPSAAQLDAVSSAPGRVIRLDSGGALTFTLSGPLEASVGGAARTFGDRVVDDVVLHARWLAPTSDGPVTLFSPLDAGRPAGTF